MQDKKVQCPFLAAKSGEDPGRMVNLSWVGGGGGGGVSRAHSNWFHAVAITLPRTVKSSK